MNKNFSNLLVIFLFALVIFPITSFAAAPEQGISLQEQMRNGDKNAEFKRVQAEMEERRQAMKEQGKMLKEEAKITMTQKKEDLREEIKMKKEEMQEKVKAEREAFKMKLSTIRDERKKTIVEGLDVKMSKHNKTRTDHFVNVLEKLTEILDRTQEKVTTMKAEGKNTAAVETAINAARAAIAEAQTIVSAQAAKEYIISVTEEEQLKTNTQQTIQTMQTDLKTTRESLTKAKEAVHTVFKEIAKVNGNLQQTEASPSAAQ